MTSISTYYKNALKAALLIGLCNIAPIYLSKVYLIGEILVNISSVWKIATSFLILVHFGKLTSREYDVFTYGKSYGWSLLACILAGFFEATFLLVYIKLINTTYVEESIDMVMALYRELPEYNSSMSSFLLIFNKFMFSTIGIYIQYIFSAVIAGAFISLFTSISIKHSTSSQL